MEGVGIQLGQEVANAASASDFTRRQALTDWLETDLPPFFLGRILPVDGALGAYVGRCKTAIARH